MTGGTLHAVHPLVLTLTLDKSTHTFLTGLRTKYFPSHRNHLSAHCTLFHAIPPHRFEEIDAELNAVCQHTSSWEVFADDAQLMGNRGVMIKMRERPSKQIEHIHAKLLRTLKRQTGEEDRDRLTNQDLMPLRHPHVTVLNKAQSQDQVDTCLEEVRKALEERKEKQGKAIGFELWEYVGGPWKPFKAYALKGEELSTVQNTIDSGVERKG